MTVAAGTVVTLDRRSDTQDRHPVWEKIITYGVVTGDTTATITIPIDGILQKVIYKRPDTTNNDLTSQLTIADGADNTIFDTGSGLAEALTSFYNTSEPLVGACDVLITFNEDVAVTASFVVTLRGI